MGNAAAPNILLLCGMFVPDGVWDSSISLEYINLIIALVIYSVRYPAIFWSANKCLGLLFSFLLFINGQHIVLSFAGISVLYKVSSV